VVAPKLTPEEERLVTALRNNAYWHGVADCLDRALAAVSLEQLIEDLKQSMKAAGR